MRKSECSLNSIFKLNLEYNNHQILHFYFLFTGNLSTESL